MDNNSTKGKKNGNDLEDPSIYGPSSNYIVQVKFKPNLQDTLPKDGRLSSKIDKKTSHVDRVLKGIDNKVKNASYYKPDIDNSEIVHRSFDKTMIALRLCIRKLAAVIDTLDEKWVLRGILMEHMNVLHQQIDLLIKEIEKV